MKELIQKHSLSSILASIVLGLFLGSAGFAAAQAGGTGKLLSAKESLTISVLCVNDGGGSTGGSCLNATAFTSITSAVAAASPGDEIRVAAGDYIAPTLDKALTLRGGFVGRFRGL